MKKTTKQETLHTINKNKLKLQRVSKRLKKDFIGLDDVIDQLMFYVEPWYLLPDLLDKPIILNLWGITGVGKTDLVEKLVNYLGYDSSFLKIEIFKSDDYSLVECLYNKYGSGERLKSGGHNVLFFDELQNFRTVEVDKGEVKDKKYYFKDFWELLNSGLLDLTEELDNIINYDFSEKELNSNALARWKRRTLSRYLRILELDDIPFTEYSKWTVRKLVSNANKFKKERGKKYFDCRRSLVILAGNLDEAYTFSDRVADINLDADEVYDFSKEISFLDIKQALLSRFRPEQIARFGNNHIVYPTLSRDSYERLIKNYSDKKIAKIKEGYGIDVDIRPNLLKLIYDNGVFPTQGVRPVFTTISSILGSCIPQLLLHSLKTGSKKIYLDYEEPNIIISPTSNKKQLKLPYKAAVDELKKEFDDDETALVSVHEVGHALTCALLCGVSPQRIKITSGGSKQSGTMGYIRLPRIGNSEELILKNIKICLGGRAAERLIFGKDLMTSGAKGDITHATNYAAIMVRKAGLYGSSPLRIASEHTHGSSLYTSVGKTDFTIEDILNSCDADTANLLNPHKTLIKELAKKLQQDGKLDSSEFIKTCKQHGVQNLMPSDSKTKINSSWNDILHKK